MERLLSQDTMRRIFNEARLEQRAREGTIKEWIRKEPVVDPAKTRIDARVPLGSLSQDVRYLDSNGDEICRAHRYKKPDGTIGGSGLTDPKTIFIGGTEYHLAGPFRTAEILTEEEMQIIVAQLDAIR